MPNGLLYLFYGEDDFSRHEALERLKAGLGTQELLSANTAVLDGGEVSLEHLVALVNTVPFLAEHRLIIVEGLLGRWNEAQPRGRRRGSGRQPAAKSPGEWESLPQTLSAMSPSTVLVFLDGPLVPNNPLLALLRPLAKTMEFPLLKGYRLQQWIRERVRLHGGALSPDALRLLAEISSGSLWALATDIEKLCLYAAGREVSREDVTKLVTASREANIFALVDAILEGRPGPACQELADLLSSGFTASRILPMISRQLRLIALAKDLSARGINREGMPARLGITSDYALGKVLQHSDLYTLEGVKDAYQKVVATEFALKTTDMTEPLALELMIMDLIALRASNISQGQAR